MDKLHDSKIESFFNNIEQEIKEELNTEVTILVIDPILKEIKEIKITRYVDIDKLLEEDEKVGYPLFYIKKHTFICNKKLNYYLSIDKDKRDTEGHFYIYDKIVYGKGIVFYKDVKDNLLKDVFLSKEEINDIITFEPTPLIEWLKNFIAKREIKNEHIIFNNKKFTLDEVLKEFEKMEDVDISFFIKKNLNEIEPQDKDLIGKTIAQAYVFYKGYKECLTQKTETQNLMK